MSVEFVDTNLLIYAHTSDDRMKHEVAGALLDRLGSSETGAISTQVLMEFYSTARRVGLKPQAALAAVESLREWELHRPRHRDITEAIRLHQKHSISFWDAMIVSSAIELGASVLWTEDLQNGQRFGKLTIRNPFIAESVM